MIVMNGSNVLKSVFMARLSKYLEHPNIGEREIRKSPIFDILDVCQMH